MKHQLIQATVACQYNRLHCLWNFRSHIDIALVNGPSPMPNTPQLVFPAKTRLEKTLGLAHLES